MKPEVSVVIPCYNEVRYIRDCIDSLLSNGTDPSRMELLVIDGGSTDGTEALLNELSQRYPQVKVLNNPDRITPRALNIGVHAAQGTYILISSAHASFDYGYIGTLISTMSQHADAIAVGGVMETKVKNSTAMPESIRTVLMHPVGVGNAKFRTGVSDVISVDTVTFGLYRAQELKAVGAMMNGSFETMTWNYQSVYFEMEERFISPRWRDASIMHGKRLGPWQRITSIMASGI